VQEIVAHGGVTRREVMRGGLGVSRAAVWMTMATLFFVLFGANVETFFARTLDAGDWARAFSFEEMSTEVVRMAVAGLAMTLTGPLTAFAASRLMCSRTSPLPPSGGGREGGGAEHA